MILIGIICVPEWSLSVVLLLCSKIILIVCSKMIRVPTFHHASMQIRIPGVGPMEEILSEDSKAGLAANPNALGCWISLRSLRVWKFQRGTKTDLVPYLKNWFDCDCAGARLRCVWRWALGLMDVLCVQVKMSLGQETWAGMCGPTALEAEEGDRSVMGDVFRMMT